MLKRARPFCFEEKKKIIYTISVLRPRIRNVGDEVEEYRFRYARSRDFKRGKGRADNRLRFDRSGVKYETHHPADGGARNQDGVTTGRSVRSKGSFDHAKPPGEIPRKFCRLDYRGAENGGREASSSGRTRTSPRTGGNADVLERFLSLDAAGAVRYIDCRSGSPFSKWRGGVIRSKSGRLGAATTSRRGDPASVIPRELILLFPTTDCKAGANIKSLSRTRNSLFEAHGRETRLLLSMKTK